MKPHYIALALALAFSSTARAQTAVLPTVTVTGQPIVEEVDIDGFSSNTAIITEAQLRDQNAVDLASALRRTPGVQVSRYNPVGAFGGDQGGAVFIRGLGVSRPGSEIKTYIDGIPFYMGVWNHPLLDLLPINGMRAIEVMKGPQPQVNGNNFASINLDTKQASDQGVHGFGKISAGSFGTLTEQADIVGRQGNLDFLLAQGHARSDGHRRGADGELNNLLGRLAWRLDPHWTLGAGFLYVDNKARDPGDNRQPALALIPEYNTRANMLHASLAHVHGELSGELKVYHNSGDGNWLKQPAPDGDTPSHFSMSGARWKEQYMLGNGATVLGGIDYERLSGDVQFLRLAPAPQARFDAPTFTLTSPYFAYTQKWALDQRWSLVPSAGIRWYEHSQFPSKSAPHAGLSLVSDRLTVFANLSRGINYPGLEAPLLASLIPALGSSWKQLAPEQLDHLELGAKFSPGSSTQVDLSLFQDKVKNRYVFGFPPDVPPPPQFLNLGSYRMRGMELSLRQAIATGWSTFAGVTLLNPEIDNLPYTPKRALTAGLNGNLGLLRVAVDAQYQSEVWALNRTRTAGAVNNEQVSSFAIANTRIAYPVPALGRKGEVFLALENLFDRKYAYRPGYPMPGRSAQIGASASF